jgi:FKBP-type peptidyl-prolyl cis-trans isomerase FklB
MKIIAVIPLFLIAAAQAAEPPKLTNDKAKQSYTFGYQMGTRLKGGAQDMDPAVFARGVQDAMSGAKPALSQEEMVTAAQKYQQQQTQKRQAAGEENRKRGEAYLAENRKKAGVKVLESGVQYKVIKEGNGKSPTATDTVSVHYRGTHINGTEFDSSYKRNEPATFPVNGVIPGWQQVLPLMKEGAKWEVAIPASAAYGERGAGGDIGPNETLLFEIELLTVK